MNSIRQIIIQAKTQADARAKLLEFLQKRQPFLHSSILLPDDSVAHLADFVERYILHVPDFIDAIQEIILEAKIEQEVKPIITVAANYFLSPPDLIDDHRHLIALLDEAYLAHRLLEEVNDRFMAKTGVPLTPMDNTTANLIVHELIGEPFANLLDQAVLFSAELLLNEQKLESDSIRYYIQTHKSRGWSDEIKRWPCLADELEIRLQFTEPESAVH
jgi:uncharacterized membrane protein YkvA (DUF1232 family)